MLSAKSIAFYLLGHSSRANLCFLCAGLVAVRGSNGPRAKTDLSDNTQFVVAREERDASWTDEIRDGERI